MIEEDDPRPDPRMFALARKARGMSQSALAKRMSTSQPKVSGLESGAVAFSRDYLSRAADALDFPEQFFGQEPPPHATDTSPFHHRKLQSVGATRIQQVHATLKIVQLQLSRLLPEPDGTEFEGFRTFDPEEYPGGVKEVAQTLRAYWGAPAGPIEDLVRLVEEAGAVVVLCDFGQARIDGLSRFVPGYPPMVFLNKGAPGDRQRWTLAHEVGHLIMHVDRTPTPGLEREADEFASEFLLPAREIRRAFVRGVDLPKVASLKRTWKVSMQALIMAARSLDLITDSKKKNLFIELSRRGWRTQEPIEIPREEPRRVRAVLDGLREDGASLEQLAERALCSHRDLVSTYYPDRRGFRVVS